MPLVKRGGVSSWDDLTDKPESFTPSAHALNAHTAVTLAELNAIISDADLGPAYTLPTASADTLGGIKVAAPVTVTDSVLGVSAATTSAAGLMSASDKVKVDGVPVPVEGDAGKSLVVSSTEDGYELGSAAVPQPSAYFRTGTWSRYSENILESPESYTVDIGGTVYVSEIDDVFGLDSSGSWDATSPTDYTVAANRAGKDFYIYACVPVSGRKPVIVLSANSTYPSGYDGTNSRKIGGFHCLCVAVNHASTLTAWAANTVIAVGATRRATTFDGYIYRCTAVEGTAKTHGTTQPNWASIAVGATIVDAEVTWLKEVHALEGLAAGDILPASCWDLNHRPICSPEGMVWSEAAGIWVDIYLQSGTGTSTKSANGGTITDTRTWMDFVDDLGAVGKRLLDDGEFQKIAAGGNEETNIAGSADPDTTTGHTDTAGRRMISNIGCEDCAGVMNQWLLDQSYRVGTGAAWGVYNLPGNKGDLYNYDSTEGRTDVKLIAGGAWPDGSYCGSRCRSAFNYRWKVGLDMGARGCCGAM